MVEMLMNVGLFSFLEVRGSTAYGFRDTLLI
jgi:hypothetical protein